MSMRIPYRDLVPIGVIAVAFSTYLALTWPLGNAAYDDDFAYIQSAFHLFDTGKLAISHWSAASLVGQLWWAQPFLHFFGRSIASLQLSTFVLHFVGTLALYGIARLLTRTTFTSGAIALVYGLSALALDQSLSFLTEVPVTSLVLVASFCYIRSLKVRDYKWALLGSLILLGAFLVKQIAIVILPAYVAMLLLERRFSTREKAVHLLAAIMPFSVGFAYYYTWLNAGHKTQAQYLLGDIGVIKGRIAHLIPEVGRVRITSTLYFELFERMVQILSGIGLLLLPLVPLAVVRAMHLPRTTLFKVLGTGALLLIATRLIMQIQLPIAQFMFNPTVPVVYQYLPVYHFTNWSVITIIVFFFTLALISTWLVSVWKASHKVRLGALVGLFLYLVAVAVGLSRYPYFEEVWWLWTAPVFVVFFLVNTANKIGELLVRADRVVIFSSMVIALLVLFCGVVLYYYWPSYLTLFLPFVLLLSTPLFKVQNKIAWFFVGVVVVLQMYLASARYILDRERWNLATQVMAEYHVQPAQVEVFNYAWLPWWYYEDGLREAQSLYGSVLGAPSMILLPMNRDFKKEVVFYIDTNRPESGHVVGTHTYRVWGIPRTLWVGRK